MHPARIDGHGTWKGDMDLLTDVCDVSRIGYGFMASKALFAALDLDLFTLLARQASMLDELAEATAIPAKRLQTLMTALRALGLVGVGTDGRFINSPAAAAFLSKSSPSYYGDYFRFQIDRQVYPHMEGLLPAMHGRAGHPFYDLAIDSDEARHFSVAQHVGSMGPAHLLSRRFGPVGWRRLLDVAGGTWRWGTSRMPAWLIGLRCYVATRAPPTGLPVRMQ
jgi:2-hydroxy-4-(methylsulfanyl)butanoate S-methyltransferase